MSTRQRTTKGKPVARADILQTDLGDELVLYDPTSRVAHTLNRAAAAVFRGCDGERDLAALQVSASDALGSQLSSDTLKLAIGELERAHLLEGRRSITSRPMTRRRLIARSGALAAAAIAAPGVISLAIPVPAAAHRAVGGRRGWTGGGNRVAGR